MKKFELSRERTPCVQESYFVVFHVSRRPEERVNENRRNKEDNIEERDDYEDTRKRKPGRDASDDRPSRRRPADYEEEEYDRRRPYHDVSRKSGRKPTEEYDEEEEEPEAKRRQPQRPRSNNKNDEDAKYERRRKYDDRRRLSDKEASEREEDYDDDKSATPASVSVYDRPRKPPRIRPPVPKTEQGRFSPKVSSTKPTTTTASPDEEYYDYELEENTTPKAVPKPSKSGGSNHRISTTTKGTGPEKSADEERYEEVTTKRFVRPRYKPEFSRERQRDVTSRRRAPIEEYEEAEGKSEVAKQERRKTTTSTSTTTTSTPPPAQSSTITTKDVARDRPEPVVKVVKRPFLPSRGGNPYSSRGLQPVGEKAAEFQKSHDETSPKTPSETSRFEARESDFKPSPMVTRHKQDFSPVQGHHAAKPNPNPGLQQQSATSRPKANPLDLDADEYDVTLNDALNPTLPNVPVRGYPTGFSSGDYVYSNFQRPRYVLDPTLNQASSDYVYRIEQPVQKLVGHKYGVAYQGGARQLPQSHTQAFYAPF